MFYAGVFLLLALTGCGIPVPEEAILASSGMACSYFESNCVVLFFCAMAGIGAGDFIAFATGRRYSETVIKFVKKSRLAHITASHHRPLIGSVFVAMLLAHLSIGVRPFIYLAIGSARIPVARFIALETICVSIIAAIFFWLPLFLAPETFNELQAELAIAAAVITGLLIAGVAALLVRLCVHRYNHRRD